MVYDKRTLWDQMERKLEPTSERKETPKPVQQRRKSFVSQW